MKKNGLQIVSLLLSIVLLVLVFKQNQTIEDLRRSLQSVENRMHNLEDDVRGISGDVTRAMEEATNPILDWEIQPVGIDKENQWLLANVVLELKNWQEDTTVNFETAVSSDQHILVLPVNSAGTCSGMMQVPVNGQCEVRLAAVIIGGGESQRVDLGGWGDISMLLPIQSDGGGFDGPEYRDGLLSSQFHISVTGWDYQQPGRIDEPKFQVYRNGELAQTIAAVIDPYSGSSNGVCYTVDTEDYRWSLECNEGDTIEIRFLCQDEYGLGYDFLFANWTVEGETPENMSGAGAMSGLSDLELTWPE